MVIEKKGRFTIFYAHDHNSSGDGAGAGAQPEETIAGRFTISDA